MSHTKADLIDQKINLIAYLTSKIKAADWHAVQDAASDIREIDAKLEVLAEHTITTVTTPTYPPPPSNETDRWAKRLG
jgi:hypothetical protein